MSIPEQDPRPTPTCPEHLGSDGVSEATATERAVFNKPWWCEHCRVAFTGSPIERQDWQAAKAARAAERGEIASVNERGARAARTKEQP